MKTKKSILPKIYLFLVLIFLYLPMIVVIIYSFNNSKADAVWGGFTFDWYKKIPNNRNLMNALKTSLKIALISSFIAAVTGTLGAVGLVMSKIKTNPIMERLANLPLMIPEIILGMAFLAFFSFLDIKLGTTTLVLGHLSFCIPYVLTMVKDRLSTIDPSINEAARDLGASRWRVIWDITLPLAMPAVMSGTALAFAMSMDDVVISFFMSGARDNTLPVMIYSQIKVGITPEINALSTIILFVTFIVVGSINFIGERKIEKE